MKSLVKLSMTICAAASLAASCGGSGGLPFPSTPPGSGSGQSSGPGQIPGSSSNANLSPGAIPGSDPGKTTSSAGAIPGSSSGSDVSSPGVIPGSAGPSGPAGVVTAMCDVASIGGLRDIENTPATDPRCSPVETAVYGDCLAKACDAAFRRCFGDGYKSGTFSGSCGDYFACFVKCGCGRDKNCVTACGKPPEACSTCSLGFASCAGSCKAPVCGGGSTSGPGTSRGDAGVPLGR